MINKAESYKTCEIFVAGAAGDAEAGEIAKMLKRKNYDVYFSSAMQGESRVDGGTLAAISKCKDFIVVLSESALQSLKVDGSPLSQELRRAMQRMRNVVPVLVSSTGRGFEQLGRMSGLPEETSEFAALAAVEAPVLASRLVSRAHWSRMHTVLSVFAAAAAVSVGALLVSNALSGFPRNATEREQASRLLSAVESSVNAYAWGADAHSEEVKGLSAIESMGLVRSLEGSGVDAVALAGILAAPETRRRTGSASGKESLAENVAKVLSAVHSEEAEECRKRVMKTLEGMK